MGECSRKEGRGGWISAVDYISSFKSTVEIVLHQWMTTRLNRGVKRWSALVQTTMQLPIVF